MLRKQYFLVLALLAIFGLSSFYIRLDQNGIYRLQNLDLWIHSSIKNESPNDCIENLDWLRSYQLSYPLKYASRIIYTTPSLNASRSSLTYIDSPLFSGFSTVDIEKSTNFTNKKCLRPLEIEVAHQGISRVNASNMIFGLQTTMTRLRDTVKHLARWLPHTDATLYAIVIENEEKRADDFEMAKLQDIFHGLNMKVTLMHPVRPEDSFAQRYFSLISVMYQARDENTQWISCIDDDTFFPSMYNLQAMLAKYDTNELQYIGSLSEDWWAVKKYGLMAFGGAGVFLSLPMAKIVYDNRESCGNNLRTTAGDITVMDCIYRFSSIKLTNIPTLHQVDMHGDISGLYESGREILSLHHWKEGSASGYKLEIDKMHLVADICESCFLQRWKFSHNLVLSNGFSISNYPNSFITTSRNPESNRFGSSEINLDEIEYTWNDEIDVLHSLAPTREKLSTSSKISYRLLDSILVNDFNETSAHQIYFLKGEEKSDGKKEMDTILVLKWHRGKPTKQPINDLSAFQYKSKK